MKPLLFGVLGFMAMMTCFGVGYFVAALCQAMGI